MKLQLLIALIFVQACALPKVSVTSDPPEANVYLRTAAGSKSLLGKTPLAVEKASFDEMRYGLTRLVLEVEKDGHISETFFLELATGSSSKVHAQLQPAVDWKDQDDMKAAKILDSFAREVQGTHTLISQKKYETAHQNLLRLTARYPEVSILYDLQGSAFLLEGRKDLAIKSYEKSLQINPLNIVTKNFLNELKKN